MKIKQSLFLAKEKLKEAKIPSFDIDATILLSHLLFKPKEFIIFNPDFELSGNEVSRFEDLISRRQKFEPISHIIQKREFYSRDFIVTKDVLDPRPDSETLIEYVLKNFKDKNLKILELGVGSGCLIITLLSELNGAIGKAVDISINAIKIAKQNRAKHNLENRLEIIESDLFSNIKDNEKFDLIISNPPYIKTLDIDLLQDDVKNFEPISALDGGDDGLDFYRQIAKYSGQYLLDNGSVIVEIGANQEKEIVEIFQQNSFNFVGEQKDLAGIIRILHFKK